MPESTLEQRLEDLRGRLASPSVDVARAVAVRVAEERTPRRAPVISLPRSRSMRRAVLVAVAAVLLLGAAALAGRLGVPGLEVIFHPGPRPTNVPIGRNLFLGHETTLSHARDSVGFEILTPRGQDLAEFVEQAERLTSSGIDALCVTDPDPPAPRARKTPTTPPTCRRSSPTSASHPRMPSLTKK